MGAVFKLFLNFSFYFYSVVFSFCPGFPGCCGTQHIKEMMDNGWPRSPFLVTNGFGNLCLKEAVVDTGNREGSHSPGVNASCRRTPFQMSQGAQWSLSPLEQHPWNILPQTDAFSHRMGTPVIGCIWHPRSHHNLAEAGHTQRKTCVWA